MTRLKKPIVITIDYVENAILLRATQQNAGASRYAAQIAEQSRASIETTAQSEKKAAHICDQIDAQFNAQGIDWRTWSPEPAVRVGNHDVEFKDNGVQVGCTFVPKETVLEIAKRLQS
jgi:hypothetical protein